ncbi:asparaginase domain-containing protein [Streptomyces sp. INA 01156]
MRRIQVVATGGTIASRGGAEGRRATVLAKELVASVGPLPACAEVSTRDVVTRGSYAFGTADLLTLVREVRGALHAGADGVVMTHGTDTMEETAFLLDLAFDDPRPIVLTGAQRPFDDRAADGPANLGDALAVAADEAARGQGPLLVFDGFAFPARGVRKSDTMSAHAFTAPGRGPALRVVDGHAVPLSQPRPRPRFPLDLDLPTCPGWTWCRSIPARTDCSSGPPWTPAPRGSWWRRSARATPGRNWSRRSPRRWPRATRC